MNTILCSDCFLSQDPECYPDCSYHMYNCPLVEYDNYDGSENREVWFVDEDLDNEYLENEEN